MFNIKIKSILAGALMVAIVGIKIIFPTIAMNIKETVHMDIDYRAAFSELGIRIADEGQAVAAYMGFADKTEGAALSIQKVPSTLEIRTLDDLRADIVARSNASPGFIPESILNEAKDASEPALSEAPTGTESPIDAAMEVFLQSQEEFSEYEIPANVSYSTAQLPFEYVIPVEGMSSSGFGYRVHPISDTVKYHYGTDFAAYSGTDIYAFADGCVSVAGYDSGFGDYIVVSHSDGYSSLYAHCSKLMVSVGDEVSKGQLIALVGATGQVTGPHLHFELMCGETYLNPEFYINAYGEF